MGDLIITKEKILRKKSLKITGDDYDPTSLIDIMKQALPQAWIAGFGFAGIQVGIASRVCWYIFDGKEHILINPQVINMRKKIHYPKEACLSIPGKMFHTERYLEIDYRLNGGDLQTAVGIEAIIIQHEIDHMDGILCSDRQVMAAEKVGRNEPCPCGSGSKYKKCHGGN